MIEQVQCSNPACGKYKVSPLSRSFEDPQSHKKLSEFRGIGCLTGFIVWIILGMIFAAAAGSPGPSNLTFGIGIFGTPIIGLIVVAIIPAIRRTSLKSSAISVYLLSCDACGKRWEERRYPNQQAIL